MTVVSARELADYAFAGFVMVSARRRLSAPELLQVSLTPCLATLFPNALPWAWSEEQREQVDENAVLVGYPEERVGEVCDVIQAAAVRGEIADYSFVQTIETARALRRLLPRDTALMVVGCGLHLDDVPAFVTACTGKEAPEPHLPSVLSAKRAFPAGGAVLGFELLVTYEGLINEHSWICNGLDNSFRYRGGQTTPLNQIESRELALDWSGKLNRGEINGEPGLWLPWLLVDYTALLSQS
jgi:hypothetical protein